MNTNPSISGGVQQSQKDRKVLNHYFSRICLSMIPILLGIAIELWCEMLETAVSTTKAGPAWSIWSPERPGRGVGIPQHGGRRTGAASFAVVHRRPRGWSYKGKLFKFWIPKMIPCNQHQPAVLGLSDESLPKVNTCHDVSGVACKIFRFRTVFVFTAFRFNGRRISKDTGSKRQLAKCSSPDVICFFFSVQPW